MADVLNTFLPVRNLKRKGVEGAVAAFLALLAVCSIDALSFSVADAGSTIADAEAKAQAMDGPLGTWMRGSAVDAP
eukprot:Skav205352  [mRNA]  locus=scaffold1956:39886:40828:- [translate_table: standard]